MKIKLIDIEPNPYRHIDKYPIDRAKVNALKTSIKEKTFWDNILVRPHPTIKGKFQLAYGHHRWIALKELKYEEINIPCRNIENAQMLQIMAEENLNWSTSPAVATETVLAAKEFLDSELAKYENWDSTDKFINSLGIENQAALGAAKKGIGRDVILKFLGSNWKGWMIQTALSIIKDEGLDQKAVKTIPTMEQAKVFRTAVKSHETPKPDQKKIAKKIAKEGIGSRDIPAVVAEFSPPIPSLKKRKVKIKSLPNVVEYVFKLESDTFDINRRLKAIVPEMEVLANEGRLLGRLMPALTKLNKTIEGVIEDYEKARKEAKEVASV